MSEHTYKVTEAVGTSTTGVTDAISQAAARASRTLDGLDWLEVSQIRGHVANGLIAHYQVR
jgi:dodecin